MLSNTDQNKLLRTCVVHSIYNSFLEVNIGGLKKIMEILHTC